MTSTCDSAESIATLPPESDLDDEQIRDMLAYRIRERKLCVELITFPNKRGET